MPLDPDKVPARRAYQRAYRKGNVGYKLGARKRYLSREYGVDGTEWVDLTDRTCEICGRSDKLRVDHHHGTGKVRGILCNSCNRGLGLLKDSPLFLRKALQYLKAKGFVGPR
jgi:hypothetical protein